MRTMETIVVVVIVAALVFDFTNGFHDTANAMATSIATGALPPRVAVLISGALNLVGAFLSVEVAKTISGGLVDDTQVTSTLVFGGLVGAILWNLFTWLLGLPSSSSHALVGGLIGATWAVAGVDAVNGDSVIAKIVVPAVLAPVVAGLIALVGTALVYRITRHSTPGGVSRGFRIGQIASASLVSLAHGTNDAQKTMGIITLTLIAAGSLPSGSAPPFWVVLSAGLAIGIGTAVGGWRIIRTLGRRITELQTRQGFAAETSSTAVILVSSHLGFPLSTTQVCSGSIFGSGAARNRRSVRWGILGRMAAAWALTMPAAGLVGALAAWVASRGTAGLVTVLVVSVAASLVMVVLARRSAVGAHNVNDLGLPLSERMTTAA